MVDVVLESEIISACASLGYSDGPKYHLEADCYDTIKDLNRYLRRDDESHQIRRILGDSKVVKTDLIQILEHHSHNKELFDVTLRLLVHMTTPVLLIFKEELPEEKITRQHFLQILSQQQEFKEAFAYEKVWSVLVGHLGSILQQDCNDRDEEERMIVERILILVRNILAAPSNPEDEKRTDDDASIHDQVLWSLHLARFEDLVLYIASSDNEQDLCMHVLEIIRLMLKEQEATQLASAGIQRSISEKKKDEEELMSIREREAAKKKGQITKHYNARHSRFGGSYYVTNMKSISDRDLISHSHISDIKALNFDNNKKGKKIPKNRLPLQDADIKRRSTLAIRLFLQQFCIEFLNGAYNSIMYTVKDNLNRALAQEHDESYYLWAIEFFLQFNRTHNFKVEFVTESLNLQQFHYIQTLLENYFEMMTTDKKKIPVWSRRMLCALKAYEELLRTLYFMDQSPDVSIRESSGLIKRKVFYVVEYREMALILLQNFDELKMSKTYLKHLVETVHVFLKLLEGMCKKHKHLIVQKVKKNKPKKKHKAKAKPAVLTEEELISKWDQQSDSLVDILSSDDIDLPDVMPFDPLSSSSEEEQKEAAMRNIHKHLRSEELQLAVSLLRSSRDLWPGGDIFGHKDMDPMEETFCLRTIFMANLGHSEESVKETPADELDADEEEFDEEEEYKNNIETPSLTEQEFSFDDFIRRFANSKVIPAYCLLFKNYFNNSAQTNHCILKMFHRIAWECKLPGIFFQASLFRVFQEILNAPNSTSDKDAIRFIKYILNKFVDTSLTNKKVFAELLFWKTNREALELEIGYGASEVNSKPIKTLWKEEEEDELQRLYEEFKESANQDKDVVDLILDNLINRTRTRRMIIKKLKELGLVNNIKELSNRTTRLRVPKSWTEEEEDELRKLFEEHKECLDPISRILDHMLMKRPRQRVIDKVLELGLAQDRKELRKKRAKKAKNSSTMPKKSNIGEAFLEANASSSDDISDNDDNSSDSSDSEEPVHPKRPNIPVFTPKGIKEALDRVKQNGQIEAIGWIAELLEETASDRESDGDFEPIPVLPITTGCLNAMEDALFGELLVLIGLQRPISHQEMFWRIPSNLSISDLRKRSQFLTQALNNQEGVNLDKENQIEEEFSPKALIINNRQTLGPLNQVNISDSPKAKNNRPIAKKQSQISNNSIIIDSNSDDEVQVNDSLSPIKSGQNISKRLLSDSEEDDFVVQKSLSKKPKAIVISDDSD